MTWVAVAVAGATVVGSVISAQGAKDAANTQAGAARDAQGQIIATGEKASKVYQPYVGSGNTALSYLNYGMGQPTQFGQTTRAAAVPAGFSLTAPQDGMYSQDLPPEGQQWAYNQQSGERIAVPKTETVGVDGAAPGFEQGYFTRQFNNRDLYTNLDPGYQFRLRQGQQTNQQFNNATGGMVSGNALKSLQDYTQNFASGEYSNAFDRFNKQRTNIYNQLSDIAKIGLTGSQGQANTQIGTGTNVASITSGLGNAQAASQIAQGNIYGNAANTVGQMSAYSAMNQAQSPYQSMGINGNQSTGYTYNNQVGPTESGGNLSSLNMRT
jgi:hypothetical protein